MRNQEIFSSVGEYIKRALDMIRPLRPPPLLQPGELSWQRGGSRRLIGLCYGCLWAVQGEARLDKRGYSMGAFWSIERRSELAADGREECRYLSSERGGRRRDNQHDAGSDHAIFHGRDALAVYLHALQKSESVCEHQRPSGALAPFLEAVPKLCPHDLFTASVRASQTAADFIDRKRLTAQGKENFATRTAALIIPAVGNNYLRHEKLQRFMLANDSVTVAVEVPIWLTRADITALERHHGIRLLPEDGTADQTITGHIDFLQIRNGAVHILDYKPDARTNRPFAQLTIYALALTRLAGLRLFDIKCAWFNEHQYCEFFPRTVLAHTN
jgi:PD-(D/E)XK nuclease superfamily